MSEKKITQGLIAATCLLAVVAQVACRPGLKGDAGSSPVGQAPEPAQDPDLALVNSTHASAYAYTGAVWATQPIFGLFNGSSMTPRADLSGSIDIEAYLNPSCSTPADGTFSISQNPLSLSSGLAAFSGISYALPGHLEQKLYLKASHAAWGLSVCTGGTSIRHPFRAGFGYVHSVGPAVAGGSFPVEQLYGVAIDSQGRIVVAGESSDSGGNSKLAVWRYNPDGTLDTSFGGGAGYVVSGGVSAAGGDWDLPSALVLDAAGRIVISGYSVNAGGGWEIALWRYNPDGTPDTSFSGDGRLAFGSSVAGAATSLDTAYTLAIDGQGRLVVTGNSRNAAGGREIVLLRYNADGTLDTTFGGGDGYVTSGPAGAAGAAGATTWDRASEHVIDSQGRHLLAGFSRNALWGRQVALWRYTADGVKDTTFGGGTGYIVGPTPGPGGATGASQIDGGSGLRLDAEGRWVVAGVSANPLGGYEMALWRFTPEGALDPSFGGGDGMVAFGSPSAAGAQGNTIFDQAGPLELDAQGRLIVTGGSTNPAQGMELAIWRYLPDGSLDPSFGSGKGYVTFGPTSTAGATGARTSDRSRAMKIDSEGRLLLAGHSTDPDENVKIAIWRYLPDGTLDK